MRKARKQRGKSDMMMKILIQPPVSLIEGSSIRIEHIQPHLHYCVLHIDINSDIDPEVLKDKMESMA